MSLERPALDDQKIWDMADFEKLKLEAQTLKGSEAGKAEVRRQSDLLWEDVRENMLRWACVWFPIKAVWEGGKMDETLYELLRSILLVNRIRLVEVSQETAYAVLQMALGLMPQSGLDSSYREELEHWLLSGELSEAPITLSLDPNSQMVTNLQCSNCHQLLELEFLDANGHPSQCPYCNKDAAWKTFQPNNIAGSDDSSPVPGTFEGVTHDQLLKRASDLASSHLQIASHGVSRWERPDSNFLWNRQDQAKEDPPQDETLAVQDKRSSPVQQISQDKVSGSGGASGGITQQKAKPGPHFDRNFFLFSLIWLVFWPVYMGTIGLVVWAVFYPLFWFPIRKTCMDGEAADREKKEEQSLEQSDIESAHEYEREWQLWLNKVHQAQEKVLRTKGPARAGLNTSARRPSQKFCKRCGKYVVPDVHVVKDPQQSLVGRIYLGISGLKNTYVCPNCGREWPETELTRQEIYHP